MGSPLRDRPLRTKKPKKSVEEDEALRAATIAQFLIPDGPPDFKRGYRECLELYAIHAPNRRGVARILDEHCVLFEEECLRSPTRENYAAWEGFRAAIKELARSRNIP